MAVRVVALLLAVVLSPGVAEAAEDAAHWIAEGHTLHVSAGEHAASGEEAKHDDGHATDEHGCSALFHLCGCHSPAPSMVTARVALDRRDVAAAQSTSTCWKNGAAPPDGVRDESFRPPIA